MSLLDPNVVFVKGFFNVTMGPLSKQIDKLAIIRLDGDMYQSAMDVLYNLYDKLALNGYVIVDDWTKYPSGVACRDFIKVHKINSTIIKIDDESAYWQKTENVTVQKWRHAAFKFTD